MKMKRKFIIPTAILLICCLGFGLYSVFAELKFDVKITADDTIINNQGDEFVLTVSSDNLTDTGLSAGQFYIEYDSNLFTVNVAEEEIEAGGGVQFLQDKEQYFSSSIVEENGIGKITVLYYDNSNNLDSPLVDGEMFKIPMRVIGFTEVDKQSIKITGEGFSTIEDNSIVDMTGIFTNEEVVFRKKDVTINDLNRTVLNANYDKPLYNGESIGLSLNVLTTDLDDTYTNEIHITRSYKYGDINLDGVVDDDDYTILGNYLAKWDLDLTELQLELADVVDDGEVNSKDSVAFAHYVTGWTSNSLVGEINDNLSTVYYIGDPTLDGVIDSNDVELIASYEAKLSELSNLQFSLADITDDGIVDLSDGVALNKYISQESVTKIGKQVEESQAIYGDIYVDGIVNNKDLEMLRTYLNAWLNPDAVGLQGTVDAYVLSDIQELAADINEDGNVDSNDFDILELYDDSFYNTNFHLMGLESNMSDLYFYGDINNDKVVDESDIDLLTQYINGDTNFTDAPFELANVNNDNDVDETDLTILQNYVNGSSETKFGLNYISSSTNINKYGDINLDGEITTWDLDAINDIYNENIEMTYQMYLNLFGGEYNLEFVYESLKFKVGWYGEDITLTEYISNFYENIGFINDSDILVGDVNQDGRVNGLDAMKLARHLAFIDELTETEELAADVNNDGIVDLSDYSFLRLFVAKWDINGLVGKYKTVLNRIGTVSPEVVNEMFDIEDITFTTDLKANNYKFTTKENIEPGVYQVIVSSSNGSEILLSNSYEFVVEPKPIESLTFENDEYTVGVNNSKETNVIVGPENTYNKSYSFSVKDSSVATVDENGIVTGISVGETILYANATDGSSTQGSTKIVVVEKNITLSNLMTDCSSFGCEQEVYDKTGGVKTMDIELQNIESSTLEYILTKSDDNNQTNLADQVAINFYPSDTNKLEIVIESYDLEAGNYTFKVVGDDKIESNSITFGILEYIPVTSIDILYNNNSISSLTMIKGDTLEISNILNENATNKEVVWGINGINGKVSATGVSTAEITATDVSEGTLYVYSKENNNVIKTISLKIIEPTSEIQTQTKTSNIGNHNIDIKYGGTYTNIIQFNNAKEGSKVEIQITGKDNEIISEEYYDIPNDIIIENGIANIGIIIPPNVFPYNGKFVVKYTYQIDDVKQTKKTGTYNIYPQPFVPVSSIEVEKDSITLIKGQETTINYNVETVYSTYTDIDFESNNTNVLVDENGNVIANEIGDSIITLKTKDDSGVTKNISVRVIDYDISSTIHNVNLEKNKIKKIKDRLSYNDLMKNIATYSGITTKAYKNDVAIDAANDLIGTGAILKTYLGDELFNSYTLIVSGDLNGDGKVLANDILAVKMHILEKNILENENFTAGDIDDNSKVNATDILYMKRYILEKTTNVWGE